LNQLGSFNLPPIYINLRQVVLQHIDWEGKGEEEDEEWEKERVEERKRMR